MPQADDPPGAASPPPESLRRRRLAEVCRRWHRTESPRQRDDWRLAPRDAVGRVSGFFGMVSSLLLIPFSQAIYPLEMFDVPVAVTLLPFRPRALTLLALLALINAWLLDGHLDRRTPRPATVRPWVRRLRLLACSLPLVGRYALPGWRWLLARRPRWAFREPPSAVILDADSAGDEVDELRWRLTSKLSAIGDRLHRRLTTQTGLGLLAVANAVALVLLVFGTASATPTSGQRLTIAMLAIPFHLLAFGDVLMHQVAEARRQGAVSWGFVPHALLALLWLAPVPYLALAGLAPLFLHWLVTEGTSPAESTLVQRAFAQRREGAGLPSGLTLEEAVRRGWQGITGRERWRQPASTLTPSAEQTRTDERLQWLYRVRSILLAFDAMAVWWLVLNFAPPAWHPVARSSLAVAAEIAALLCLLGVMVMIVYLARLVLRNLGPLAVLDRHPYAQYLAASQLSLATGLWLGPPLFDGDRAEIAAILSVIGTLGLLAAFSVFVLGIWLPGGERSEKPYHGLLALLGFLAIAMAGQTLRQDPSYAQGVMTFLMALTWSSPLWGLVLYRRLLPWLLRPFRPEQGLSRELPVRRRWAVLLLTFSVALPLGGVMIPLWIYVRHRRLPRWAREISAPE